MFFWGGGGCNALLCIMFGKGQAQAGPMKSVQCLHNKHYLYLFNPSLFSLFSSFRLIWVVMLLGMSSLLLWFSTQQFILFLSYPTSTRVTVRELRPLPFPAVTICNLNQFRRSYAGKKINSIILLLKTFLD